MVVAMEMLKGQLMMDRVEQIMHLADKDGYDQLNFDEFACAEQQRNGNDGDVQG